MASSRTVTPATMRSLYRSQLLIGGFGFVILIIPFINLYVGIRNTAVHFPTIVDAVLEGSKTRDSQRHNLQDSADVGHQDDVNEVDPLQRLALAPPRRIPTHEACAGGYDGIYHIIMGDIGGAAGTIFFQFVIGQILYAERNNLKPWVFFNNVSYIIYDDAVHAQGPGVRMRGMAGRNATWIRRPNGHIKDASPGPPDPNMAVYEQDFHFAGTGVWEHYFEPISDFVPGDKSCDSKLYVTMDLFLITPGIHGFSDWAPRCWRYKYLPDYITKPHIPLTEWLEPQRKIAHSAINRYIRFRPEIKQAAMQANPNCSSKTPCLGLHIRHSDKAAGRRVVETLEFLPYAQAFVHSGGKYIYLATDSHQVLQEIQTTWPESVTSKIRTIGSDVVRSSNETAVFDIGSHHRTNVEVLIEILALSKCQYMIHGLSAVSESSTWINLDLHLRSVNMEDPERLTPAAFGTLVQMENRSEYEKTFPRPLRTDPWWKEVSRQRGDDGKALKPTNMACEGYDGVLLISSVGKEASFGRAMFTSVLNQLLYAEKYNLKPWVHLGESADLIYDPQVHGTKPMYPTSFEMMEGSGATVLSVEQHPGLTFPGKPVENTGELSSTTFRVAGTGIWDSYFEPVSDFVPGDASCRDKPLIELEPQLVDPGLDMHADWSVKAWQYDEIPVGLWRPSGGSVEMWYRTMREEAFGIVKKYFQVKPYIHQRATQVNPVVPGEPCLGVHIRTIDKRGKHRKKVDPDIYVAYMEAFQRAGGRAIYIATDSRNVLQYLFNKQPDLVQMMRSQGQYVVRSSKGVRREWLPHFNEEHHRVNSEALVDVVALSKCKYLIHGYSTLSEAAIYLNPSLLYNSVNVEIEYSSVEDFESLVRSSMEADSKSSVALSSKAKSKVQHLKPVIVDFDNATILRDQGNQCQANAIVYLAQKFHSSYGRDSYANFQRSLGLLISNYLSIDSHGKNVDLFIFHTNEFNETDWHSIHEQLGPTFSGTLHIVDISDSPFWALPKHHLNDNPKDWKSYPLFSEGYRRMMHFFAIDIWEFFEGLNEQSGCAYRYIMRLDEDSYIRSPIRYDIFDMMRSKNYAYGFRMCAYEMHDSNRMWTKWTKQSPNFVPKRPIDLDMCGFYNNFFVADLGFFRSPNVTAFLRFIDRQGHIYRRRLGDLNIHSMSVYGFAPPERIHRFLDFTYEHFTINKTDGCALWGGIQAGYDDTNASATLDKFYQKQALEKGCQFLYASYLGANDLSPTYSHLSAQARAKLSLHTITAGDVELPVGKGILSG